MSARDTRRNLGSGPHDTWRELPRVARDLEDEGKNDEVPTPRVLPPPLEPEHIDGEKTGARKKFDPYRFQANTVPPGMRAELLEAEPEENPRELMQDTLPPQPSATRATHDSFPPELEDGSGVHPSVPPRPVLRPVALVSLSLAAIAFAVLVVVAATRPHPPLPPSNVAETRGLTTAVTPTGDTAPDPVSATNVTAIATNPAESAPSTETSPRGASTTTAATAGAAPNAAAETARSTPHAHVVPPRAAPSHPKTAAQKPESPVHPSRNHSPPDLETPLMP